jgi:CBS domain-containing protein
VSRFIRGERVGLAAELVTATRDCDSTVQLAAVCRRLPTLWAERALAGASAAELGAAVTELCDAVTCQLVRLTEQRLGPAPVPYAWLACGSQARRELTLRSDQDNGLLLGEGYDLERDGGYFTSLARSVCHGLDSCGFSFCAGDVMASNATWRQPLAGWKAHFQGWILQPAARAMMHASIFLDMRVVAGEAALLVALEDEVASLLRGRTIFVTHLVANALRHTPPVGFFGRLTPTRGGDHDGTVDLKHGGIIPIVDLGRIYAVAAGQRDLATDDRLRVARERGVIDPDSGLEREAGFAFLGALRAKAHANLIRAGVTPDDHVRLETLTRAEQRRLSRALHAVRREQEVLATNYHAGLVV